MANKGLSHWVTKLRTQNTPVLNNVIVELNAITGDEEADVNQMAEVILRDANLTSHVLRVANSVQYNYGKARINTVSRAVVLIGLKGMRAICISLLLIDSLLTGKSKQRVLDLMAQGFHAATQARNIVLKLDSDAAEEAFIAGLLYNLGEMAFWAAQEMNPENEALINDDMRVRRQAMETQLGTSFKAVTKELARHWKLGETLEQVLAPSEQSSDVVKAVVTGERISRAALFGWDSPQVKKVVAEVSELLGISDDQSETMIKNSADQAAEVALDFGVNEACPLIPSSRSKVPKKSKPASKILKGDAMLQLNILRDLSNATYERMDVNTIFQMVVEGMHRGIGLERVVIAFIKKRKLQAKYMLGEGTEHWRSSFMFDVGPYSESIFTHAMEKGGNHWFTQDAIASQSNLYPNDLITIVGRFPSFVSTLQIDDRKVALFYADRWNFGGRLSEDQFESFKHFSNQAQASLNLLSSKGRKQ